MLRGRNTICHQGSKWLSLVRASLTRRGWRVLDESLWSRIETWRRGLVFIAPPLDTIPSSRGNAIYTLIEQLAERSSGDVLVLCRWPDAGVPAACALSDRILYDTAPLRATWLEKCVPYRMRKAVLGMGAPLYVSYARRAGEVCGLLQAGTIVVEDVPMFVPAVRRFAGQQPRIILHQHMAGPVTMPSRFWRRVTDGLDGAIFVADRTRRLTEARHGRLPIPATVVYNGVDLRLFDLARWASGAAALRASLGVRDADKVALYVGRIAPEKGVAEVAEAFNLVAVEGSHMVIVGDVDASLYGNAAYSRRVRAAAERSYGRVRLVGAVPQEELPRYYAAAAFVVVPSLGSEGLPKAITEALAMKRPCVVTDRGGALEIVVPGWNGWVVPEPATVEGLAQTLLQALVESDRLSPAQSRINLAIDAMAEAFFAAAVPQGCPPDRDAAR